VLELLGDSLGELFQRCQRKFSLKTVLLLANQIVSAIEQLHLNNYIHRDIKPENFVMGAGNKSNAVFLIDFGLSKLFRNPQSGLHIAYCEYKNFTGTARYASINSHLGAEQSRRDDLEALGYIFVYFLKGKLPWQNLQTANKKDKYEKIFNTKVKTSVNELCEGLPLEFESYLSYCRRMKFNERPDYIYIKKIFHELFIKQGYDHDCVYDWSQPRFPVICLMIIIDC
jgi:serine/threonine protein kinase